MGFLSRAVAWLERSLPRGRRAVPPVVIGGAVAALVFSAGALPYPGLVALANVWSRPSVAFTVLVGPTGLTFPCWASGEKAPLTPAARPAAG